ncbi:hypothetical protein CQW23_20004 [Capsicum baccatum]|uniref:Uncharacterized protein n=1 Tax=Capsicum baccatum TaxID=33114 RepID=A0A2G2W7D6_CAPBA|nr:hypothetical protein CQW23_20004 [Capsicum baccatum]
MLDVAADGSRPLLRINVISGSPTVLLAQPTIDEYDSFEDESLDAHPIDSEDDSMELEDSIFSKEGGEKCELGAQTNHTFSDGTNSQIKKYECTDRFVIYKYVGDNNCGVEYATRCHRKISSKVIALLCVNMYRKEKGPDTSEIRRIVFKNLKSRPSYWKYWLGGDCQRNGSRDSGAWVSLPACFFVHDRHS